MVLEGSKDTLTISPRRAKLQILDEENNSTTFGDTLLRDLSCSYGTRAIDGMSSYTVRLLETRHTDFMFGYYDEDSKKHAFLGVRFGHWSHPSELRCTLLVWVARALRLGRIVVGADDSRGYCRNDSNGSHGVVDGCLRTACSRRSTLGESPSGVHKIN